MRIRKEHKTRKVNFSKTSWIVAGNPSSIALKHSKSLQFHSDVKFYSAAFMYIGFQSHRSPSHY